MHKSVLLQEVVAGLQVKSGDVVLDATVGGGGHSEALCRSVVGQATFVCLDADEDAIQKSRQRLKDCNVEHGGRGCKFIFGRINYRELDEFLARLGIPRINRALFDLGLSSFQLESTDSGSGRGFSFMRDEPLEMTFAKNPEKSAITAKTILNEWSEETIATLLESYGEERQAKRIARRIVEARAKASINTTMELKEIVESVVKRRGRIHPATKTFQALRIAVNDEFQALKDGLQKAWDKLLFGGRIAVISFHSLEDRTVKNFFKELGKAGVGKVITKKPIVPTKEETRSNPRSRSAKLRIIEKINNI